MLNLSSMVYPFHFNFFRLVSGLSLMAGGGCNRRSLTIKHVMLIGFLLCVGVIPFCLCLGTEDVSKVGGSCIESERRALLALKADIYDPGEWLSSWTGQDCCQWRGVGCDNTTSGHVVKLDLRYPVILFDPETLEQTGELPGPSKVNPSISSLIHLRHLDLSMNNFSGAPIPKSIGSLMHLEYLNLSQASFSGPIPRQIGNLSKLHSLDLGNGDENYPNALRANDLRWVSRIPSLQYLDLSYANLSKASNWLHEVNLHPSLLVLKLSSTGLPYIPSTLQHVNFTSLTMLDLSYNYFQSAIIPHLLLNISSLVHLDLSFCGFPGRLSIVVDLLENLNRLKHLEFSGNQITGDISQSLGNNRQLEYLDLSYNQIIGHTAEMLGNLSQLRYLELGDNQISGEISEHLGNLSHLEYLSLSDNRIWGEIPKTIGNLAHLRYLDLSDNNITKQIPKTIGNLAHLWYLDLSDNNITGQMPENISMLCKLLVLGLTNNTIGGEITGLIEGFSKCSKNKLDGRRFLQSLVILDLSYNNFGGTIPQSLGQLSRLKYLGLSWNSFTGYLTEVHFSNLTRLSFLDLSSNCFSGAIPNLKAEYIILSNNSFSGPIPLSFTENEGLVVVSLSHNHINGSMPQSLCNWTSLVVLDLSNNELSGGFPDCWSKLQQGIRGVPKSKRVEDTSSTVAYPMELQSLHMRNNSFYGEFPSFLRLCKYLVVLDLGENRFSGNIPTWIGESLPSLGVLQLRSNFFVGNIPMQISSLSSLQVLDLACNNFSGNLPSSFGNFAAMVETPEGSKPVLSNISEESYYKESLLIDAKGSERLYNSIFLLVTSIDLSHNNLFGEIPNEVTNLHGLYFLNLSGNHFIGKIPQNIGDMRQLESLDLSMNNLYGQIPQTMLALTYLSQLNLSYNSLSGRIPSGNQFSTFNDPSIYIGNHNLCGQPLPNCPTNAPPHQEEEEVDEDDTDMIWIFASSALGFIMGFWGFVGAVMIKIDIRISYLRFIDRIYDWVYIELAIKYAKLKFVMRKSNCTRS